MNNILKKENAALEALCSIYRVEARLGNQMPLELCNAIGVLEFALSESQKKQAMNFKKCLQQKRRQNENRNRLSR